MRALRLFPAVATASVLVASSVQVLGLEINLNQALQRGRCSSGSSDPVCTAMGAYLCSYGYSVTGGSCNPYQASGAPQLNQGQPVDFGTGLDETGFRSRMGPIDLQLQKAEQMARTCCGKTGCPQSLWGDSALAYQRSRVAHLNPEKTAKAGRAQLAKAAGDVSTAYSGMEGLCRGQKEICASMYEDAAKSAGAACSPSDAACKANLADRAANNFKAGAQRCRGIRSEVEKAKPADDIKAQATKDENKMAAAQKEGPAGSSGSGTGGAGGATPSSTGGNPGAGGGMGGMGQMASSLLPALMQMAMMQNQQGQQQQQPGNLPQGATGCETKDAWGNSILAGCGPGTTQTASLNGTSGDAGPTESSNNSEPKFNLPDGGDTTPLTDIPGAAPGKPTPITTTPVANGGGPMPGGQNSSPASLGSAGGGGGGGGAKGNVTEIDHGLSGGPGGGGLASMAQNMQLQTGGGGGGFNYGNSGSGFERLKLAEFLPGGSKYAGASGLGRGLAALSNPLNPTNLKIHSKKVNIWARITDCFRSKCAQGLLRDCGP